VVDYLHTVRLFAGVAIFVTVLVFLPWVRHVNTVVHGIQHTVSISVAGHWRGRRG